MSNEEFRRELNNVFDEVSGTPSSNLRDRVRASVTQAPAERAPYWLAGVAAVVIAALIVGVLYIANPLRRLPPGNAGPVATASPSPTSSSTAQPSPSPSASPSTETFICAPLAVAGSSAAPPPLAYISGLRTGTHGTYDRLTVDFGNRLPTQVTIGVQSGTTFTMSPSGVRATLKGQNGILVTIYEADLHTSYSGPIDLVTGYSGLAEVRRVQDFEGMVQLGLGVNGPSCYHAFLLTNPNRLVIDVQTRAG